MQLTFPPARTLSVPTVLAVRAHDPRPPPRALPVEHGHHRRPGSRGARERLTCSPPRCPFCSHTTHAPPRKARTTTASRIIKLTRQLISQTPSSQAEAELLAAIVSFFRSVGLAASDVGIRVSNRKVLQAVLERCGVPADKFAPVCVIVDKMEKIPREAVEKELAELGVEATVIDGLLQAMAIRSLDDLAALLGKESPAVKELVGLFALAKGARGFRCVCVCGV